ncbi:sensor histidine kinase [Massilia cavernae]|uniref:Sensor histidine kinase n=1 Tax=Massilia cavernae TaxID=2320864 RepID=A0A418XH66_9BURK|nr:histidine kinase [Massilia cavernae]RJG11787.1 sensor histidine kinase [Massilia cavernae]
MQGPLSTRRSMTLYLMVWLMLGLVLTGLVVSSTGAGWINGLLFALPMTVVYAFATGFSAYYLCRAYPLSQKGIGPILMVLGVAALVSGLLWTAAGVALNSLWWSLEVEWAGFAISPALKAMIFGLGTILYGLSAVAHYLAIEFDRARLAERRELESKLMAQEAELRMLRTQIDPHFLFNSLNSISALTSVNPAGAREMTLKVANFFRHTLGLEAHTKATVDDEVKLVRDFLAIEKVRFGSRLRVECDIDDDARPCLLPPMILQPLVENAVKHGIGNLTGGGVVSVAARRDASLLRLSVENDVDEDMPAAPGTGIGLANVQQRLATAYGHEGRVVQLRRDNKYRVELTLPAQTTREQ